MVIGKKASLGLFILAICLCFIPFISPAIALLIGMIFSLSNVEHSFFKGKTAIVLKASIVLMGFGMNLVEVLETSKEGLSITTTSVLATISVGLLLGILLKVNKNTSMLISVGTAICGGSAIAAIAPVINAKNTQILFSMAVVFVLNAIALIIFPYIGHYFNLSQEAFGYWAAIAIHDTSSVVGAGAIYGDKALELATTIKLTRALWIIPLSIGIAFFNKSNEGSSKVKIPWFIACFILAIIIAYFLPQGKEVFTSLNWLGKRGMVIALFLVGSSLSLSSIKKAGAKSFLQGIILWIFIATTSLYTILHFQ